MMGRMLEERKLPPVTSGGGGITGNSGLTEIKSCFRCGSVDITRDYVLGVAVCNRCGSTLGTDLAGDDDRGIASPHPWNARSNRESGSGRGSEQQFRKIREWQKRVHLSGQANRNLYDALKEIERLSAVLSMSRNVMEYAAVIYRKALRKNLIRGRTVEGMVSGCLYTASVIMHDPRTLVEIAEASNTRKKEIGRDYRILCKELNLSVTPSSASSYVDLFCSRLQLSQETRKTAMDLLREAENAGITSGKAPNGVAASAIYVASTITDEKRTQYEISKVCGVTEVTLRNRQKDLEGLYG